MKRKLIAATVAALLFGAMAFAMLGSQEKTSLPESAVSETSATSTRTESAAVKICPHSGLPCEGDGDCGEEHGDCGSCETGEKAVPKNGK